MVKQKSNNLVVAIYSHIEGYPPSINAVQALAKYYNKITILCNNVLKNEFQFDQNIEIIAIGNYTPIREFEVKSIFNKIIRFINYTFLLKKQLKSAETVIVYDSIPLLAFKVAMFFSPFTKKPILWYHNHDVNEPGLSRKYSIGWFAEKNEPKMFPKLDIFSLPSNDRKQFFPMEKLKGKYFFIPNFPAKSLYHQYQQNNKIINNPISILYQGSIGDGHGLETIIEILPEINKIQKVVLVLKGFISDSYKNLLIEMAKKNSVEDLLIFKGVTSYREVPLVTANCDIGIAIHSKSDRMNKTLGTASNKIYEYAACGLPVLYYNAPHYLTHLQQFEWAFAVDVEKQSILNAINKIILNYTMLSNKATSDFNNNLNFEYNFNGILKQLQLNN